METGSIASYSARSASAGRAGARGGAEGFFYGTDVAIGSLRRGTRSRMGSEVESG